MTKDPKKEKNDLPELPAEAVEKALEGLESTTQKEREAEPLSGEKATQKEIRQTIEAMDLTDGQASQAQAHANDAVALADEEKIAHLFGVAKKKGVIIAVAAAKKMNNPHVLDMLHDRLAKEGYYKEFLK